MALKVTTKEQPKGTVHVMLRGPSPEPPANVHGVEVPIGPDGGFEAEVENAERLGPGDETVLGDGGTWRGAEPE